MSKFQIILLSIFGLFIMIAVMTFALYKGSNSQGGKVLVWGSIPSDDFYVMLNNAAIAQDSALTISYAEKSADSIESAFTEALARGQGPDLVILRQDQLWKNKSKLLAIPYSSISQRDFTDTFAEAGEVYLGQDGVYGLPILIDPLILYYNRDHLSGAAIGKPLSYWDELYAQTTNLSKRDNAGNLVRSAVALGEVKNIRNAKDIMSLLLLQAGTPITGFVGGELKSFLNENMGLPTNPSNAALEFYTQFSNPTKAFYSWNRALPEAQTSFTGGSLAYYLGFASEYRTIKNKNPLLNFAVAPVPQSRVSGKTLTTGRIYAVSVSRGTTNPGAALAAALKLIAAPSAQELANLTALAPARRDLLSGKPTDAVLPVFYVSALQTRAWTDPDSAETKRIFSDMVESVTSGRARVTESLLKADTELRNIIE